MGSDVLHVDVASDAHERINIIKQQIAKQEPFSVRVTRPVIQGSLESLHTLTS